MLPDVPIVFALTNPSQLEGSVSGDKVTGRYAPYPFDAVLDMAQRLQPDAARVAIIGGISRVDSVAVREAVKAAGARPRPLGIIMLRGLTYDSLMKRVAALPSQTIVLHASFRMDQRGQRFIPGEILPDISQASSAPVYSYMRAGIGQGVVGGAVMSSG